MWLRIAARYASALVGSAGKFALVIWISERVTIPESLSTSARALSQIEISHVEPPDQDELIYGAIRGMEEWATVVSSGVSGTLIIVGVVRLRHHRLSAYRWCCWASRTTTRS